MRNFVKIAAGVEVLPLLVDLYQAPGLWNERTERTGSGGPFVGTDDIWVRFRDPAELTSRYLTAIAHPMMNIITHPANRTPVLSPGYDVDFDRLFAAAAESGTAMEVDGAPGHLDMDGALARRAAAAGVTIVVDSDCHRADALARQMRFGVGTARRGWLEPRHVLNTRGIDDIRAFVAAKRARA